MKQCAMTILEEACGTAESQAYETQVDALTAMEREKLLIVQKQPGMNNMYIVTLGIALLEFQVSVHIISVTREKYTDLGTFSLNSWSQT